MSESLDVFTAMSGHFARRAEYGIYYLAAKKIAEKAFKNKVDLAGNPYINHISRVADQFDMFSPSSSVAYLHDLLEDCPRWTEERLLKTFSKEIIDSVVALTKKKGQSYTDYIKQVCGNETAMHVKLADLKDNMNITRLRKLSDRDFERLKKYHSAYKTVSAAIKKSYKKK